MSLTDNTFIARKNLNHLPGSPYAVGDEVPGSDFSSNDQAQKYLSNGLIDVLGSDSGASPGVRMVGPIRVSFDDGDPGWEVAGQMSVPIGVTPAVGEVVLDWFFNVITPFAAGALADVGTANEFTGVGMTLPVDSATYQGDFAYCQVVDVDTTPGAGEVTKPLMVMLAAVELYVFLSSAAGSTEGEIDLYLTIGTPEAP